MTQCPCCGQETAAVRMPITSLREAPLSHQQRTIVDTLARAYPRTLPVEALIAALYDDDPDGGPLDPKRIIAVQIFRLRQLLPSYGWTIPSSVCGRGNKGRYRLEPQP